MTSTQPAFRVEARGASVVVLTGTVALLLPAGLTLPPSRTLAAELGCSRWVVTEAYAQLVSEGYLVAATGSATGRHFMPVAAEVMLRTAPVVSFWPAMVSASSGLPPWAWWTNA